MTHVVVWLRAACLAGVLALATLAPAPAQQDPLRDALAETDTEFLAIKDNVATARERLGNVGEQLGRVEDFLKRHPRIARRERDALMRRLGAARETLRSTEQVLETFGGHADKVTGAADAVKQVRDLAAALRSDRLSDQVRALGAALERYGGDVPLIGAALAAYGQVTTGLVDATDKLDKQIGETFRQDQIGSAIHGGKSDPRYRKLVEQFGKEFADRSTYAPDTLRQVFRPIDRSRDVALIWDAEAGAWHRVDGEVPVETIFADFTSALGHPPTAAQLRHLADNHQQAKARAAMADALISWLGRAASPTGLGPAGEALTRLPNGGEILLALRTPDLFRARFTYAGAFQRWLIGALQEMRDDLADQGPQAARALAELDGLLAMPPGGLELPPEASVIPPTCRSLRTVLDAPTVQVWSVADGRVTRSYRHHVAGAITVTGTIRRNTLRATDDYPGQTSQYVRRFSADGSLTWRDRHCTDHCWQFGGSGTWTCDAAD